MYISNTHLAVIVVILIVILYYRFSKTKSTFQVSVEQFNGIKDEYDTGKPRFSKIKSICPSTTAVEFKDMHELDKKSQLTYENVLTL